MIKLIDKSALVAEIENLLDKGKCHEEYDCGYRDGRNGVLYELQGKLDTLEVKEVELEKEIDAFFNDWGKDMINGGQYGINLDIKECKEIAKHFFELGLKAQKGE